MRFLRSDECADWCRRHACWPPSEVWQSLPDAYAKYQFRIPGDAGERVALCRGLWNLDDGHQQNERLVWVTDWSVWPSNEHMPLFTRWRAALGETRHLIEVPGHLVEQGDDDDGFSIFIIACLFLWDCWLYSERGVIVALSNDEIGDVFAPADALVTNALDALGRWRIV